MNNIPPLPRVYLCVGIYLVYGIGIQDKEIGIQDKGILGNITRTKIEDLRNEAKREAKTLQMWDSLKGFLVKIYKTGNVSYYYMYRNSSNKKIWYLIGKYPNLTPEEARAIAKNKSYEVGQGIDIQKVRQDERRKPERLTVEVALSKWEKYLTQTLKAKSQEEYLRYIKKDIKPAIGKIEVDALDLVDIRKVMTSREDQETSWNRLRATLSSFFSWIEKEGLTEKDPSRLLKRIPKRKERARERYLELQEYQHLGVILNAIERANKEELEGVEVEIEGSTVYCKREPWQAIGAIRLLLLLGWRKSEVLQIRWESIDLERRVAKIVEGKTGDRWSPINEASINILKSLPSVPGPGYVFPGRCRSKHFVGLDHVWFRIRKLAKLEDVTIHCFRHSLASLAVTSGASLELIGGLIGHKQRSTTERYAHLADTPVQQLSETTGQAIENLMNGPKPAEILDVSSEPKKEKQA